MNTESQPPPIEHMMTELQLMSLYQGNNSVMMCQDVKNTSITTVQIHCS